MAKYGLGANSSGRMFSLLAEEGVIDQFSVNSSVYTNVHQMEGEEVMHDEFNGENVSDMAGSGYEQEGFRGEGSLDEELEQDGHRDGGQNHLGEVFKGKDLEVEGEFATATPEKQAEIIASSLWSGILPPPDEFSKYPVEVQREIVRWASVSVESQSRLIETATALDRAESARLDAMNKVDAEQIPRAQYGTILLNLALIVGAIILGCLNRTTVACSLVGGLAAINVLNLFVSNRSSKK